METAKYALADCRLCRGRGRVRTGEGITEWAVCPCAVARLRQSAAEKVLQTTLPPRALAMTLDSFQTGGFAQNERAEGAARSFVDHYDEARADGWVLGFYGEPRSGKTHLAVAIAQAATKRFLCKPYLLNLPRALRAERERFGDGGGASQLQEAAEADLLVLDDLGAEYEKASGGGVSWISEQLYLLIDDRVMNNRPFVYTTNLSRSDMERKYSGEAWQRVYARIREAEVHPGGALEVVRVPDIRESRQSRAADLLFSK